MCREAGGALGRGQGSVSYNPSKSQFCAGHGLRPPAGDSPQDPPPQEPLSEPGGGSAHATCAGRDGRTAAREGAGVGGRAGASGTECWPRSRVTAPGGGGGGRSSSIGGECRRPSRQRGTCVRGPSTRLPLPLSSPVTLRSTRPSKPCARPSCELRVCSPVLGEPTFTLPS